MSLQPSFCSVHPVIDKVKTVCKLYLFVVWPIIFTSDVYSMTSPLETTVVWVLDLVVIRVRYTIFHELYYEIKYKPIKHHTENN